MNKLPERLNYLESVREELRKLPPEELDEMTDTDSLVEVLRKRVEGLSNEDADDVLSEDIEAMASWLKDKENSEYPCHFVYGFLIGTNAENLRSEPEHDQEIGYVHAQFPENFKVERENVGLNATCKKLLITIVPFDEDTFELLELQYRKSVSLNEDSFKMSNFVQGDVSGYKIQTEKNKKDNWKRVEYLLKIPGWCVSVMMDSNGKEFDEISLEPFLETIEIKPEA
jgi:hypothetical protein